MTSERRTTCERTLGGVIASGNAAVRRDRRRPTTRSRRNSTRDKPITLTGIVTKVEWTNPHVWFYINVKDAKTGEVMNWGAEMGPPHGLQRRGWRQNTLKIGDSVTVAGSLAKNGAKRMNASKVTLTSTGARPGETLDAASSGSANVDQIASG